MVQLIKGGKALAGTILKIPSVLVHVLELLKLGKNGEEIRELGTRKPTISLSAWSAYITDEVPDIDLTREADKWWSKYQPEVATDSDNSNTEGMPCLKKGLLVD